MCIEIGASSLWIAGAFLLYVSVAVNIGRCVAAGKPAQRQARRRQLDERLAGLHHALIVLGQPAVAAQPREAPLDDPAARLNAEGTRTGCTLDDFPRPSSLLLTPLGC